MAAIITNRGQQLIAVFVVSLLCLSTALSQPPASKPGVGRIIGNIDGISRDGEQFFIAGWACQQGRSESIQLHIFAGADPARKVFLTAHKANFYSEAAVEQACRDQQGGKHRFLVALPFGYDFGSKFFVHGIRVVDGVANDAIAGSGMALRRLDMPQLPFRAATVPAIAGSYRPLAEHPRVFTTAAEIKDLVARINRPGSYSARRYGQLARQAARDLAAGRNWDATYSGCSIGPYLYAFSYEPQDGHDAETHAALKLDANTIAPAGGAVVASRLALYAALDEMALQYYACYGKSPGFYKTVSRENARACPNFEQYYGKLVNSVDPNIMIGAFRFPHNAAIGAVEAAAKDASSSGVFSLDAVLFGKWTD